MVFRVNVCKNEFSVSNIERVEMDIELLLWRLIFFNAGRVLLTPGLLRHVCYT